MAIKAVFSDSNIIRQIIFVVKRQVSKILKIIEIIYVYNTYNDLYFFWNFNYWMFCHNWMDKKIKHIILIFLE